MLKSDSPAAARVDSTKVACKVIKYWQCKQTLSSLLSEASIDSYRIQLKLSWMLSTLWTLLSLMLINKGQ